MLEFCVGAHAEGKLGLADDRILVLAEVVAEPEYEIRVERRIDVEVHAEEFEFVLFDFGIRIVIFEADAESELLCDVEARFHGEEHLVVRENLRSGGVFLIDDGIEVVHAKVEDAVVHARFDEEGVDSVALVRVQAIDGVDAIVEHVEALGVVEFRTERVAETAADFRAEYPVHTRGDGQVFVRTVQKLDAVACECGDGALAIVRCTEVELAFAELAVADFDTETADGFVAGDDRVASCVAPEVVVERSCAVGQVTEDETDVLERLPAEFYAVEVECRVAFVKVGDCGRTGETVANFGIAVSIRCIASCVRINRDRNVFVEVCRDGQVDILVCGIGGVKIPVEIAGEVKIDVSVDFDVCGRGKTGSGKGNRQNNFTHTILPKRFIWFLRAKDRNIFVARPMFCA